MGTKDVEVTLASSLAALYLRGGPPGPAICRRRWPDVLRALRAYPREDLAGTLARAGFCAEAMRLEDSSVMRWASRVVEEGSCLCVADEAYPRRWLSALGGAAPPAVWCSGGRFCGTLIGIVGGRSVPRKDLRWASSVASEAVALGLSICSGGAAGCDTAAERGALAAGGSVLRIAPHGLDGGAVPDGVLVISCCAPGEPFSGAAAMERNALIYAAAAHTVVVRARFGEGGTWHGAREAVRRRLSRLVVQEDRASQAHRALISLGAVPLALPANLPEALQRETQHERTLFSTG